MADEETNDNGTVEFDTTESADTPEATETAETSGTDEAAVADSSEAEAEEPEEGEAEPEPEPEPEVEKLHGVPVSYSRGQTVLHPGREEYVDLVAELREQGFWMCLDVCGVDYLIADAQRTLPATVAPERFEVVVNLLNFVDRERIRIRVQVPADDANIPTITQIHPGAGNPEREVFDLFGIDFVGHPDMTRILMPDDWEGHPLRKDYSIGSIPVQFKESTTIR